MFGYRLIRDADYKELADDLRAARGKVETLLREMIEAKADARSKATASDHMTLRLNTLEIEAAQLRHQVTGQPQIAPKIMAGPAIMSEAMGAGVDLFDDVGDATADKLRAAGLLHDPAAIELGGAAELSADAIPN